MSHLISLIGLKFGRLTVIERAPNKDGRAVWQCRCYCGAEKAVQAKDLRGGRVQSCGCLQKEIAGNAFRKFNYARHARERTGRSPMLSSAFYGFNDES